MIDGILLCADTQYTGGTKIRQSKLFDHNFGGGPDNVAMAFGLAGSETYGKLAIEECVDSLSSVPAARCHDKGSKAFSRKR